MAKNNRYHKTVSVLYTFHSKRKAVYNGRIPTKHHQKEKKEAVGSPNSQLPRNGTVYSGDAIPA